MTTPVKALAGLRCPELQEGFGIIGLLPEVLDLGIKIMVIHETLHGGGSHART